MNSIQCQRLDYPFNFVMVFVCTLPLAGSITSIGDQKKTNLYSSAIGEVHGMVLFRRSLP